jgi:hypothetical protein
MILKVRPGNDGLHERTPWAGTAAAAAAANFARDAALEAGKPGARVLPLYWWANGPLRGERVREPAASVADAKGARGLRAHLGADLEAALVAVSVATGCRGRVARTSIGDGAYRYACAGTGGRYVIAQGLGGERFLLHDQDGRELAELPTLSAALGVAYDLATPPPDGVALQSSGDVL